MLQLTDPCNSPGQRKHGSLKCEHLAIFRREPFLNMKCPQSCYADSLRLEKEEKGKPL